MSHPYNLGPRSVDLESGVRITCDVAYLCANFTTPRLPSSPFTPDVRDRQTSNIRHTERQHALSLNALAYWWHGIINRGRGQSRQPPNCYLELESGVRLTDSRVT